MTNKEYYLEYRHAGRGYSNEAIDIVAVDAKTGKVIATKAYTDKFDNQESATRKVHISALFAGYTNHVAQPEHKPFEPKTKQVEE